jgi:hypothetical protein
MVFANTSYLIFSKVSLIDSCGTANDGSNRVTAWSAYGLIVSSIVCWLCTSSKLLQYEINGNERSTACSTYGKMGNAYTYQTVVREAEGKNTWEN